MQGYMKTMLLLLVVTSAGCGGGSRAEALAEKSMEAVYAEAAKLSVNGLQKRAGAYCDAIRAQKEQMQRLRQAQEKLSYNEKMGAKAAELNRRMLELGRTTSRLMERHQVYIDKLQEKGLPTDAYQL